MQVQDSKFGENIDALACSFSEYIIAALSRRPAICDEVTDFGEGGAIAFFAIFY
jgi:hypothetical protein